MLKLKTNQSIPEFIKDVIRLEVNEILKELKNSRMKVILVPAPEKRHEGHKIRVVESRPPNWYMEIYKTKGRKTFKRHRFIKSLKRIKSGDFSDSSYTYLALEFLKNKIGY